ncbi:hypothetical protein L3Q82_012360 [Scortum barcoo]|uniref:Uncharacterized protein n=1 Tax=Scortum barcoo TaxID=214431 RepID=A0ACB8W2R0_9TELE|nr:hypothetical protein L3Q82_012360 [Scortum barcoo]
MYIPPSANAAMQPASFSTVLWHSFRQSILKPFSSSHRLPLSPTSTKTTVPTRRVQCFSNKKPWVTPDLRALLLEKRRAFQSGEMN